MDSTKERDDIPVLAFRPKPEVWAMFEAERDSRPGVTVTYLLNEIVMRGMTTDRRKPANLKEAA